MVMNRSFIDKVMKYDVGEKKYVFFVDKIHMQFFKYKLYLPINKIKPSCENVLLEGGRL